MNYADIKQYDVANGPGVRVSVFVSGCNHHCKNCFNEVAWDFNYGNPFNEEELDKVISYLAPSYVAGLSLLGGEPFEHTNQIGLLPLVKKAKEYILIKISGAILGLTSNEILWPICMKNGQRQENCYPISM